MSRSLTAISIVGALACAMLVQMALRPFTMSFVQQFNHSTGTELFKGLAFQIDQHLLRWGDQGLAPFKNMRKVSTLLYFDWWILDEDLNLIISGQDGAPPEVSRSLPLPRDNSPFSLDQSPNVTMASDFKSVGHIRLLGRLPLHPNRYLVVERSGTAFAEGARIRTFLRWISLAWGAVTVMVCFILLVIYFRVRAKEAKRVLQDLKSGDLNARFRVRREDEISKLMLEFNAMAEEIQRLVEALRRNEEEKVTLVQELGHDLRTPLTSVQASLESILEHGRKLKSVEREEIVGVALHEMKFLVNLLDDLFLIASARSQQRRSRSVAGIEMIAFNDLVANEVDLFSNTKQQRLSLKVKCTASATLSGDSRLLRRLIRNLLSNAAEHARSEILVEIKVEPIVTLTIKDDGPGFTKEAIENYGRRQNARTLARLSKREGSTGLGSVIIRSIVSYHQGELIARNIFDPNGKPRGAEVVIRFPEAAPLAQAA